MVVACALLGLAANARAQDVSITLDSLGISGSFKPGGYVPVRVSLLSDLDETTSVLISFEVLNSDGDTERYTRQAVLAPGQSVVRWLYPHLPPAAAATSIQSQIFTVRVYVDDDGVPGRELAATPVSGSSAQQTGTPVEMTEDLLLVVGTGQLGLRGYQQAPTGTLNIPSLNERSVIVNSQPENLPDRWQGYAACTRIIWADASPQALGLDEASAIREWVRRGGRLVIVLPEAGDPWDIGGRGRTALSDLLPQTPPIRHDNTRIKSLMQVLSKNSALRTKDATMSIRLFDPEGIEEPWEQLAALPAPRDFNGEARIGTGDSLDGAVYAIQRRFGFGWVVILGIDADAIVRRQLQAGGLPQADVFWNRLLARRGTMPSMEAYRAYSDAESLRTGKERFGLGRGQFVIDEIRIGGPSAGLAVLIALGIFIVYWVLAGPASYTMLRARGLIRYSWLVFVSIAIVFTFIALFAAWGGRAALRADSQVKHLTFLDVIDGENTVRATSWFSAYLPGYGKTSIAIPGEGNLLSTWSPPPLGSLERFPNSDTFQVPNDSPNAFEIPSRATSAHFVARWQGELEGDWRNVPKVEERKIKQSIYPGTTNKFAIEGLIRQGLPWKLKKVSVILVSPFRSPLPSYHVVDGISQERPIDAIPNVGVWAALQARDWPKGEGLDLRSALGGTHTVLANHRVSGPMSLQTELDVLFGKDLVTQIRNATFLSTVWKSLQHEILQMYVLFDMLPQPIYLKNQAGYSKEDPMVHRIRWLGRETDCSSWFIRPCVMLIATLEDVPSPVPLEIDGNKVDSTGTVVLRWIHELPVDNRVLPPIPRTLKPFEFPLFENEGN